MAIDIQLHRSISVISSHDQMNVLQMKSDCTLIIAEICFLNGEAGKNELLLFEKLLFIFA